MNNNRQIAKQKFDEHFMFKDNPIAWTAWKMAFQLGIEHQQALHKENVSCRCFMVFNPMGEDWEQMSIAFKTFEEAKVYYDRQDRKKYPYLRILAELSYNGS